MSILELIESVICTGEHIDPEKLHIKSRISRFKETRQIIMYFAVQNKITHEAAAGYFGLDHATCVHACKVVESFCQVEKTFGEKIAYYSAKLETLSKVVTQVNYFSELLRPLESEIAALESRLANLKSVAEDIKKQVDDILLTKTI